MAETLQDTPLVSPPSPSRKRSAEPEEVSTSTLTKVNGETAIEGPPAKKTKLIRRKKRPAPPQIDPTLLKTGQPPPQTGTTFNIWYNKWAGGDREDAYLSKTAAISRWSFMRQNRTLYIGRIHVTDDIEEIVARHFQEWGEIERIRVLTARGVAFVTYVNEANSQFAKEAMAHQALDNNEILNVRWATVDPNPLSAKRELARIDEQAAEAVRRALGEKAVRQIEGRETAEEKAQRRLEAGFGLEGYEAPETVWFNKQKELEAMQQQAQLEGPQDRKLLEPATETAAEVTPQQLTAEQQPTNGIFTSSTLAALQGRTGGAITTTTTAPSKPSTSGLLVGYGSDDDN
ncbi:Pre-mRNA-splicing factor [Lithohypha guttulata]|uniref:Pre-mRNA-splicing factor CWC2 n=1 Tax=Lithohypha guttulata TaxID=1690604 RepID=A0AAN7T4G6_9EURO|nr:Pre-mRNA-splicing factor [Lithohypha guttulata]